MTLVLRTQSSGLNPEFSHPVRHSRPAKHSDRQRGHFRRRARVEHRTKGHQLIWTEGSKGEADSLRRLWQTSGCVQPMKYTPVGKTDVHQVEVVFVPGTLSIRQSGPSKFAMSVEIEELPFSDPTSIESTGDLNVIVFNIDDAGREYLSAYDNATWTGDPIPTPWANKWDTGTFPYPPSPVMDDLAANGLLLSRFHVAAMCSPTRSALITGRSNQEHGLGNAIQSQTGPEFQFQGTPLYQLLAEQGSRYERIHIGKWHVTQTTLGPVDGSGPDQASSIAAHKKVVERGYANLFYGNSSNHEEVPGIVPGSDIADHTQFTWCRHDVRDNPRPFTGGPGGPYDGDPDLTFDIYYTGDDAGTPNSLIYETDAAIKAIEEAEEDGKPFVMHFWYHAVHTPHDWDEMGGAYLSAQGYHSYGATDPGTVPGRIKAFTESVDTSIGLVRAALSPSQAAKTMIVVITDNGSTSSMLVPHTIADDAANEDILEAGKDTVPVSGYNDSHSKRSPWEGGIGAACIIHGPAVVNPGDGSAPRVWNGLCGVEDLFRLMAEWTGARLTEDVIYQTPVLSSAVKDTHAKGRDFYIQSAYQNGYQHDPFSEDQSGQIRFVSAQSHEGYKLLWVRAGGELSPNTEPPSPGTLTSSYPDEPTASWLWQFYDMNANPLEANAPDAPTHYGDMFWKPNSGWTDDQAHDYEEKTPGRRWLALAANQPDHLPHFEKLYLALAEKSLIPPGMELPI